MKHSIKHLQELSQTLKTLKISINMRPSTYVHALFAAVVKIRILSE
jgi:hypothetical protein